MARLVIDQNRIDDPQRLQEVCPFGAISYENASLSIGAACRFCRICLRDPSGAISLVEDENAVDLSHWKGIAVFAEVVDAKLHPVTLELIYKARQLADQVQQKVIVAIVGLDLAGVIEQLKEYEIDQLVIYENHALKHFRIEPYTAALTDFVAFTQPAVMLIGATTIGRSLAPRLAARLRTGLTADCTELEITKDAELIQIRPAFGGNIMAQIKTPKHRPQMATVRYKVFATPEKAKPRRYVDLVRRDLLVGLLASRIVINSIEPKPPIRDISEAEVIIVAGRGVKQAKDLEMLQNLAAKLGGVVASTRPLIENGWLSAQLQVGLSGRSVKPRLLIAVGVSGAVQFTAGISGAECIVAINSDVNAPIFAQAHYGLVGDLYKIIPQLIKEIDA